MSKKNLFNKVKIILNNRFSIQGKYILITGTKGKTSVATFLYRLLLKNNQKVGLFTSPHIQDIRERIQYQGNLISTKDFIQCQEKMIQFFYLHSLPRHFFLEIWITALFFFEQVPLDFLVVEVGIGGKWDFTNVFFNHVAVCTPIGKDHQAILGSSIIQILLQKAGIIKPKTQTLISQENAWWIKGLLNLIAISKKASLIPYNKNIVQKFKKTSLNQESLQKDNLLLAYILLNALCPNLLTYATDIHFNISGRIEILKYQGKTLILDGAHNTLAFKKLNSYLEKKHSWIFILNLSLDRNPHQIFSPIRQKVNKVILYPLGNSFWNERLLEIKWIKNLYLTSFSSAIWNKGNYFIATGSFRHLEKIKQDFLQKYS